MSEKVKVWTVLDTKWRVYGNHCKAKPYRPSMVVSPSSSQKLWRLTLQMSWSDDTSSSFETCHIHSPGIVEDTQTGELTVESA